MRRAMRVLAFHFIFSAYGFWLPNDPRGSWSDTVRAFNLLRHGDATKVNTHRSLAHDAHDQHARRAAKRDLKYPPVRFTGKQAVLIARGFEKAIDEHHYLVHALAILPDHAHLITSWHARHVDDIASHLKANATITMSKAGLHPMARHVSRTGRVPSPWARNHWCPFIRDEKHLRTAIRYVESNPVKAGLRPQRWDLVTPFRGRG